MRRVLMVLATAAILSGCTTMRTVGCVSADVALALPFYALGYNGHGGVDGVSGFPDVCGPSAYPSVAGTTAPAGPQKPQEIYPPRAGDQP